MSQDGPNPLITIIKMLSERLAALEGFTRRDRSDLLKELREQEDRLRRVETSITRLIVVGSVLLFLLSMFGEQISKVIWK